MTINGWAQIALFCGLVLLLTRPLGGYLNNVLAGRRTLLSPVLLPVERGFYRLAGIDPAEEQSWWVYARAMVVFHIVGFAFLYLLLPLCILLSVFYVWQGVPQNLDPYVTATTLEGGQQTIAQGPVASSTPTPRIPTRTPPRSPTSSRCCRSS